MRKFKKILFVADGSSGERNALSRAVELAERNKGKITLVDVLDLEESSVVGRTARSSLQGLNRELVQNRKHDLERLRESLVAKHANLKVAVDVLVGKAAVSIIRSVLKNGYDVVIKAPDADSGGLSRLFGATDLRLMRNCPCPVWISKPSRRKRYRRIVAAVDVNPNEPDTESLAREIMETATTLAKLEKSELHVVHAWRLAGEAKLRGRQMSTYNVEKLLGEIRQAHESELQRLLKAYPYERTTVHLLKGRADDVIPKLADDIDADLIVIGTVGRAGVPGLVIGNTAERVLHSVDCSVLTLKPEGFETPIRA